jgi:hypothetical protein
VCTTYNGAKSSNYFNDKRLEMVEAAGVEPRETRLAINDLAEIESLKLAGIAQIAASKYI